MGEGPLEPSHFLPKGSALHVSLQGFVKSIPVLEFALKFTLILGLERMAKGSRYQVLLTLSRKERPHLGDQDNRGLRI